MSAIFQFHQQLFFNHMDIFLIINLYKLNIIEIIYNIHIYNYIN